MADDLEYWVIVKTSLYLLSKLKQNIQYNLQWCDS